MAIQSNNPVGVIYQVTCKVTGKGYIGQTRKTAEYRWNQHVKRARCVSGQKRDTPLLRAIRKYGPENFTVATLETCLVGDLNLREEYWISELGTLAPSGYNLQTGGLSRVQHEDTKEKIRVKLLNREYSYSTIDKMKQAAKQRWTTNAASYKAAARRARLRGRPVILYNEQESRVYKSTGFAKEAGFHRSGLYGCLVGKQKTTKGYKVMWLDEFMEIQDGN